MSRLFISYARENRAFVEALFPLLQRVYDTYYDKDLTGGEKWWDSLVKEIARRDILIIILSEQWNQSEYGRKEYEEAVKRNKKILPIKIDNAPNPQFLADIHYVDMTKASLNIDSLSEIHAGIVRLTDAIARAQRHYFRRIIGVGSVFIVLVMLMIGFIISRLPSFSGEITYITSGINYDIQTLNGGVPGLIRNVFTPGQRSTTGINRVRSDSKFTISPDGDKIAYASSVQEGYQHIFVANRDGSNAIALTSGEYDNNNPSWSNDGSQLVFASNRSGDWEIYRMNMDGSSVQNLTNSPDSDDEYPDWSPTGTEIVFMSNRDGDWDIYLMDNNGDELRNLTINFPGTEQYPDWSIDGRRIVFASNRNEVDTSDIIGLGESNTCTSNTFDIYITDTTGTDVTWFRGPGVDDSYPSWSPDGDSIVYSSNRDGDYDLYYVSDDNSSPPVLLTINSPVDEFFPIWVK